jgi:putative PIN family toxin of toxin-antitoxin system
VRAVVDTNVLLSGLIWRGAPHALLEHVRIGTLRIYSSPALIAEFAGIIERPKFRGALVRSNTDSKKLLADLRLLADIVDPPPLATPVSRDPDDNVVLALAVAAAPDLIISGDNDLLVLGAYAEIPIMTPAQALALIEADQA